MLDQKISNCMKYVFIPTLSEILSCRMCIGYSASADAYYRQTGTGDFQPESKCAKGWQSLTHHSEGIRRRIDEADKEAYLDRDASTNHGSISWCFDFSTSGLVVNELMIDFKHIEANGGHVAISVAGNKPNTSAPYFDRDISSGVITSLKDSTSVNINISLIGEGTTEITKLFQQRILSSKPDWPMRIEISTKRPYVALGRSLLLVGMCLINKSEENGNITHDVEDIANDSYELNVHIHQAKRLPCRRSSSAVPDPLVKLSLHPHDGKNRFKTQRIKKRLNPEWDYKATYDGLFRSDLIAKELILRVVHSGFIGRKEDLGGVVLATGGDKIDKRSNGKEIIDDIDIKPSNAVRMKRAGSLPTILEDFSSNPKINQQTIEQSKEVATLTEETRLQSVSSVSIEFEEVRNGKHQHHDRRKSFPFLNRKPKKAKQISSSLPKIVVTNSIESIVVYEQKKKQRMKVKKAIKKETARSQSLTDLLQINGASIGPDTIISPVVTRRGEDQTTNHDEKELIRYAKQQSNNHWDCVLKREGDWIYCWHPLLF